MNKKIERIEVCIGSRPRDHISDLVNGDIGASRKNNEELGDYQISERNIGNGKKLYIATGDN